MFGRIVTTLKRLAGFQSSPVSEQAEVSASNNAKPLRAKSGRPSKAAQAQLQSSQPAQSKPKRKPSVARSTKQVVSRKQTQKAAPLAHGQDGSQQATPARQTRQPVKPAVKAKQARVLRTTRAQSQEQEQAPVQTPMVKQSGVRGKRKTPA